VLGRGDGSEGRKNGSGEVSRTGEFISHIVVMGIGEPMDNYDHVMQFLSIVTDRKGLQIGPRHITVSTSGFPARIKQFADAGMQTNLAISLHAPTNELRSQIMKINKAFPIEQLMEAVDYFIAIAHRRATISYIMLSGVNDRVKHAHELADLLSGRNVIVNLIPYNPVDELDHYQRSDTQTVSVFYDTLYKRGITVSVRQEQGADIDAACGQLRSKQMQQDKRVRAQ
jgi:23S rRNA (adenine2503-C2)-methyltransferase